MDFSEYIRIDSDNSAKCAEFLLRRALVDNLISSFIYWAMAVDYEVANVEPLKDFRSLLSADADDYFFSMNYTSTLERVYGDSKQGGFAKRENICHIHGYAKDVRNNINGWNAPLKFDDNDFMQMTQNRLEYTKFDDLKSNLLVVGHGDGGIFDPRDINSLVRCGNIKPVTACIAKHKDFFDKFKCADITDVYSYGFSYGKVDLPYIKEICQSIGDTSKISWYFNTFFERGERFPTESELDSYKQSLRSESVGFNGSFHIGAPSNRN